MDKRVIFSVAGSGKTTYIVDSLTLDKRFLIITYTNGNFENLTKKIADKYNGAWPDNVTLMTYFHFLYWFCYKPFLADRYKAKGIIFEPNPNSYIKQAADSYYLTSSRYLYSNRLSLLLKRDGVIDDVKNRITSYFDCFIIDEVQDIAGRDFNFLEQLMDTAVEMLFVGDYYQHTYSTSHDGNVNKSLFDDRAGYERRFQNKGITLDSTTHINSWRCSQTVCDYISTNLGIEIHSNRDNDTAIQFVDNAMAREQILRDDNIVKLHFKNSSEYGAGHRNWGDTKGEDFYHDVCVLLNKTTMEKYKTGKLSELAPSTRNKLYVAITRAHGNVYLIEE